MRELFRGVAAIAAGLLGATLAWSSAMAQSEPPGRVGRLAFVNGAVSFHDDVQSGWTRAVVNTPLTTGDALWTEPNARSEVSLAGTRIRMEGATELDVLALDDSQTRLQLGQGRIDVKSFATDTNQPYEIVTPRGTIKLLQQGDYYVEAGSTQDPTRLGVRAGAAQIQGLNGQVLAVGPNQVAEVTGDGSAMQLRTIQTAPPTPPAYWASRDRQVAYEPPQYLSAGMTGYEDLNAYGDWINDGSYGQVWAPRAVPSGWAPYRTGHWSYVQPWGWTWIDEQPWGFAPYHYGRWANAGNRWVWVPPQRDVRPVYAPALVAFVGGVELAMTLGNQSAAPVGWFPLGPREVYVPPYTTDRDYYLRLNRTARVEDHLLEDRWQRAQRREAFVAGQNSVLMNQRFATVVPTSAFVQSQPVMRSALRVQPQVIAAAPVAPVAAPPAPTASVVSAATPNAAAPATVTPLAAPQARSMAAPAPQPVDPKAEAAAKASAETALKTSNIAVAKTAVADMPTLARPASAQLTAAPGPKVASMQPKAATDDKSRQIAPALVPRQGAAPPQLKGAVTPAPASTEPAKPGDPPKQQQAAPQPQAAPSPAPQARPEAPRQQATPPLPAPQQGRPVEPTKPQAAPQPQPKPAEPTRQQAAPPPQAPQAPQAQQPRPEPPKQPQAAPPPQRAAPQQEGHAAPPRPQPAPQQAQPQQQAAPPPQRQPAPQQQTAPQQHQAAPQQQRQAAPPPQSQPQPQPQRQAAPQPQPQPQHQAAPQPQQHQAPQPQQAQTPKPQGNDKKDEKK
ncbi:FecR family protein [Rhodospirillales bacterium URHD0017]|nr:FecR family protein [Rhodospirillales bacterium URHD0017]